MTAQLFTLKLRLSVIDIFVNKCAVRELVGDKGANLFSTDIRVTGSFSDSFNYYRVVLSVLGMGGGMSRGYMVILRGIRVIPKQLTGSSLNCVTFLLITTLPYN